MLRVTVFVFSVVLILYSVSALSRKKDDKPTELEDQPGCYVSELGRVLNYGDSATDPNVCRLYRCFKKSDKGTWDQWYSIDECPMYSCTTVPGDATAPFPECCAKPVPGIPCSGVA